ARKEQCVLDVDRELPAGVRGVEERERVVDAEIADRVLRHNRSCGAFRERALRESRVVAWIRAFVQTEALILERVDELMGERYLEERPAGATVSDNDEPLNLRVVETEDLLALDRGLGADERVGGPHQPEQLEGLLVRPPAAGRVILRRLSRLHAQRPAATHEQGSHGTHEPQVAKPLDTAHDP